MRLAKRFTLFVGIWFCFSPLTAPAALTSPNVSGTALMLYRQSNYSKGDMSTERNGLELQEAELAFYADVDPYSRLVIQFGLHPEYELVEEDGEERVEQGWVFEPEELYAESIQLPSVTLKVGKFKASFGKHNRLHAHEFPFIDAPLANSTFLGDEGLNDIGASAAYLLPTPWYSELTAQYLRGEGENEQFNSPTSGDGVPLGRWTNLVELSEDWTAELGGSYAEGKNSTKGTTRLFGGDLTFQWRPVEGSKKAAAKIVVEYIGREMQLVPSGPDESRGSEFGRGLAAWAQYQFAQRWSARVRYEDLRVRNIEGGNDNTMKSSYGVTFDASEFSLIRAEYDLMHGPPNENGDRTEHKFYVQAQFSIGAHPAHTY